MEEGKVEYMFIKCAGKKSEETTQEREYHFTNCVSDKGLVPRIL